MSTVLDAIGKGTLAGVVFALFYGVAHLVTAWRGGNVSQAEKASLSERMSDLDERLVKAERRIERLIRHGQDMTTQRDRARIYAESLELRYSHEPRIIWPADPALEDE